ncbi:hypothetical protein CEQ21_20005 [Niallia circulans]|uniref:Uncharacterized protein n=1 Tax=Niallia circulans TaxID=1397 RepID=A0A553SL53_NIACI|nr:hypothetical protein [Niallia circulans]TRZ37724.1 hypothetical protein CEQ21_20005 [Niallia circulans]
MMEGNLFYWFAWMLWVISTFMMDKDNRNRVFYASILLIAMILYPYHFFIGGMDLSVLLLIQLVAALIFASRLKLSQQLFTVLTSFMTMLAYVSFQLLSILDPVWLVADKSLLLAATLVLLALLLHKSVFCQVVMVVLGSSFGEVVYGGLLHYYSMDVGFGTPAYFDSLLIGISSLVVLHMTKVVLARWEQHIYLLEKEKQKL